MFSIDNIFNTELSFVKKYAYGANIFKRGDIVVWNGAYPSIVEIVNAKHSHIFLTPNLKHGIESRELLYITTEKLDLVYIGKSLRYARPWEIDYFKLHKDFNNECPYPVEMIDSL